MGIRIDRRRGLLLFALLTMGGTGVGQAQERQLAVLRVAAPAQIERGSAQHALESRWNLLPGDRIATGPEGRVALAFVGGAQISLGADSRLELPLQSPITVTSRLAVLKLTLRHGALRIDGRHGDGVPQDIRLSLDDVRLRLDQADVWVESTATRKTVCVLQGLVDLQGVPGYKELYMPGDCVQLEGNRATLLASDLQATMGRLAQTRFADEADRVAAASPAAAPAATIPPAMPIPVKSLASHEVVNAPRPVPPPPPETPVSAPAATASPSIPAIPSPPLAVKASPDATELSSGWTLVAASLADFESAELEARSLGEQGLPVTRVRPVQRDGQMYYRVTIGAFPTREAAAAYAAEVKTSYGMTQVWLAPY